MLGGVVATEDDGDVGLLVAQQALGLVAVGGGSHDVEVFRCCQPLYGLLRLVVHLRGDDDEAHVAHVGGDGEAEEQHQHHGHTKKDEHRAAVTQDVARFLEDEAGEGGD